MKIGLIAMSGIRACDPELLRQGVTLPGFVERGKAIASLPSLGLLTLAGMTPKRHEVAYREIADLRDAAGDLEPFDLVAISSFSAQIDEAYTLADRYRAVGTPVVLGGLHVTTEPAEAARHADVVVGGEGEVTWPGLLHDCERGTLKPVYSANGERFDLADAPMPAFELLDPTRYNRLTIQTSRGCPWACEFCASSILLTNRYQQKPGAKVLSEIDRIIELWPRPFIEFADDNTFVNRNYWKALLPELARRDIRWFTETDISVGEDDELLDLMRAAGCVEVLIGLESPSPAGLSGLELKADWKRRRQPHYDRLVRRIQSHGIRVNGCFILGLDGHTTDIFDAVYDAVDRMELFDVQITLQTPFPGTPLHERLRRAGRLLHERDWRRCTLFDVNFRPTHMSPDELAAGFRALALRLYDESFTRRRHEVFKEKYLRPGRHHRGVEP